MDKMTPDAIALSRSTEDLTAPSPRAYRVERNAAQQRRAILTRAVRLQVIPHLLQRSARRPNPVAADQVERLAALALQASGREAVDFVTGLLENGVDAERLYLDLLTPTAALLGQFWVDDVCTFADVTIGIGHLQTAMRALQPAFFAGAKAVAPDAPRAMLMPLPGEQHTFGLSMLASFFTRAGWDAWSGSVADAAELDGIVRSDWVDLIGLSLSHDGLLSGARRHVAAIRAASRNPAIVIMVGGLPFARDAALATTIGADGTAPDGAQAVTIAARLLDRRAAPP